MAGSYEHIHGVDKGLAGIENLGDAYECIEELYFLVRALAESDRQIDTALDEFRRYKRGEIDPNMTDELAHASESVPSAWACGEAYKASVRLMETLDS